MCKMKNIICTKKKKKKKKIVNQLSKRAKKNAFNKSIRDIFMISRKQLHNNSPYKGCIISIDASPHFLSRSLFQIHKV